MSGQGRDLTYPDGGEQVPELQRQAYAELAPLRLATPPQRSLELARQAAEQLGWGDVIVDNDALTLEATETTRLFRFVDDVVVRIRPTETGSLVDLRSTSRVGQSDLGANAARIQAFQSRLRELAG